jgi:hypothetical protein
MGRSRKRESHHRPGARNTRGETNAGRRRDCAGGPATSVAADQLQAILLSVVLPEPTVTLHDFGLTEMLALVAVAVNDAAVPVMTTVFPCDGWKIVALNALV